MKISFSRIKILSFLFLALTILTFCRCRSLSPPIPDDFDNAPYITLDLKQEKRYSLDSIFIQSFMFSPVEANHLFVFSSTGETYDLNLETERRINMKSKWGKYYSDLRPDNFYHDPYNAASVWIANFQQGLIAYNNSTNVFVEFPLKRPVSTIVFTSTNIWIGTWTGLYKYSRATSSMQIVDKVAEIYIRFITPQADGKISINNEYLYDEKSDILEKLQSQPQLYPVSIPYPEFHIRNIDNKEIVISAPDMTELIRFPFSFQKKIIYENDALWIPTGNLGDGLLRINRKNYQIDTFHVGWEFYTAQTSVDSQYFWMGNSLEAMSVDKASGNISIWQLPKYTKETIDYQDSKYIYSRDQHSIIIRPKKLVRDQSIPLKRLIDEETRYRKMLDSTRVSADYNIRTLYRNYKYIHSEFITSSNPRILKGIDGIRKSIAGRVPDYYPPFDYTLISFLDSIDEPDIRGAVAAKLIIAAAQKGMIEIAVSIDTNYVYAITDADVQYFQGSVRKIHDTRRRLDSLKLISVEDDVRLWKTANIYYDLYSNIGPFSEASSVRMDYPFTYLQKLLKNYPGSSLADNAEYLILKHQEEGSHEGGDTDFNPEAIEHFNRFLEKYPDSELIPDVYLKFISLHYDYGVEYHEKEKFLRKALDYVNRFYNKFPHHHLRKEVEYFEESINYELQDFGWELDISAKKTPYKLNSPILINYSLTNHSDTAKTISVYKQHDKYSNFLLSVNPHYDQDENEMLVEYNVHPGRMESVKQDSVILPGHTFSEVVDITRWVDEYSYGKQGYYRFLQPGKYELWASFKLVSRSVPSNKIEIIITE